ncbi:MAG: outer membrane beta-barrel protein [Polyangiaceae bacterium]|nr:outer membrane beta-barrel protein [Polyangiaceae bacterium]
MFARPIMVGGFAALCFAATDARAQNPWLVEEGPEAFVLPARTGAFEIGAGFGYTQPVGAVSSVQNIGDMVDEGIGVSLDLGYRINPWWSLATAFHFHESQGDDTFVEGVDVRGLVSGLQATYHVLPFRAADPYLTFGAGYRFLWIVPPGAEPTRVLHGFQAAKVIGGIDFRFNDMVALGPAVGADLDLLLWDDMDVPNASGAIEDPRPTAFVFAGLAGRFDVGGRAESEESRAKELARASR